jgi:hypothetical protein
LGPEIDTEAWNPFDETAKLYRVFIACEISAASPTFVPNSPEPDRERIRIASLRAQLGE